MSISVRMDLSGLEKRLSQPQKRQEEYAERAAFMMRKYVPTSGADTLRDSEPLNSNYAAGQLIWNTPYAAKQYYVPQNHTTAGTTDHWDQEMKNKDMDKLVEYVKHLYD